MSITFDRQQFIEWLKHQLPEREFYQDSCCGCALWHYLKETRNHNSTITHHTFVDVDSAVRTLPLWARLVSQLARDKRDIVMVSDILEALDHEGAED